jgi:hypothetical protein
VSSLFPEEEIGSEEYEEKLKSARRKPYIIMIAVCIALVLLLLLAKGNW